MTVNRTNNWWDILGIAPASDKRAIRRAYAELLAQYHPEEHPEKFETINKAYNTALRYAEFAFEEPGDLSFEQHEPLSHSEPIFIEKFKEPADLSFEQREPPAYSEPAFNDSIFQAGATEADIDLEEALALDVIEDLRSLLDKRIDSSYTLEQENLDMWDIIGRFEPLKNNPAFIRGLTAILQANDMNDSHMKAITKALGIEKNEIPYTYDEEFNDAIYRLATLLNSRQREDVNNGWSISNTMALILPILFFVIMGSTMFSSERADHTRAVGRSFTHEARRPRPQTQNHMALGYFHGDRRPQNYERAAYWFRGAAEQGHAEAQTNLGWMYAHGRGVPQNYEQAVFWYSRAAEQGNTGGQNNLGLLYRSGRGVERDDARAVYLFRKAAEQNSPSAQTNLGQMYEAGHGVPRNLELAKHWYERAAAGGNDWAGEALNRLSSH